jgi:hypothetical protein
LSCGNPKSADSIRAAMTASARGINPTTVS